MTFTVSDKLVRERYGAGFDLSKWVEGVDYVRRKAFRGERVVFRKGFLDGERGHSNAVTQLPSDTDIPKEKAELLHSSTATQQCSNLVSQQLSNSAEPCCWEGDAEHVKTEIVTLCRKERPMISIWVEKARIAFLGGKAWEFVLDDKIAFDYLSQHQEEYLSKCLVEVIKCEGVLSLRLDLIKCAPEVEHNLEKKVELGGSGVYECKVTRLFPNQRYVGTDKGVVYVGGKPVKKGEILMAGDGIMLKKIKGTR